MKTAFKNGRPMLATLFFLFALLVQAATGFTAQPDNDCDCAAPTVTKSGQSSGAVSFSWGAVAGASGYKAWYVRKENNFTSQVVTTGGTAVGFTNLSPGTYQFYFSTVCGGEVSQIIITDDLIML
jgi:hypothetical protein